MYQSCDSDGCNGVGPAELSGWPSHMIDAPATQNRAMEWQAWRQKVSGELYYDTTYAFTRGDAWTNPVLLRRQRRRHALLPGHAGQDRRHHAHPDRQPAHEDDPRGHGGLRVPEGARRRRRRGHGRQPRRRPVAQGVPEHERPGVDRRRAPPHRAAHRGAHRPDAAADGRHAGAPAQDRAAAPAPAATAPPRPTPAPPAPAPAASAAAAAAAARRSGQAPADFATLAWASSLAAVTVAVRRQPPSGQPPRAVAELAAAPVGRGRRTRLPR